MNIGNKIRDLRVLNNFTQGDLAARIGKAANSVSQYELGLREPDRETIKKLAQVFNININELYDDEKSINATQQNGFVTELLKTMVAQGLIKDANNIDEHIMDMVINAVKIETKKIIEDKK